MAPPRKQRLIYLPVIKRIRALKAEHRVSAPEIARTIGRSPHQVRSTMNGAHCSAIIAEKIADYFGVPLSDLFVTIDLERLEELFPSKKPHGSLAA